MTEDTVHISIIIPARNEEKRLPSTLDKLRDYASASSSNHEILVVDDGSTDRTRSIAQQYAPLVKVLLNEQNVGKGASVKKGVFAASGELIIFMDADMSVPIEFLEPMVQALDGGFDLVIGSRRTSGAAIVVHQPWLREKLGQLFNLFIRLLQLSTISDTQCGFKGFKRQAALEIFKRQTTGKFAFDIELIHIAQKHDLSIKELPVNWFNSPETKVTPLIDPFLMLLDLLKIRFNSWRGSYS
ncbi:glycosyltransferase family 2 protein [bacterium]|nr:glycosyltransferase family 2 protein [bacterium]